MPKYINFKFNYDTEDGRTLVRTRRVFLDDNDNPVIEITPSFSNRVITSLEKIVNTHLARRLEFDYPSTKTITGYSKFTVPLPYNSSNVLLKVDVEENYQNAINLYNRDFCIKYLGEEREY